MFKDLKESNAAENMSITKPVQIPGSDISMHKFWIVEWDHNKKNSFILAQKYCNFIENQTVLRERESYCPTTLVSTILDVFFIFICSM